MDVDLKMRTIELKYFLSKIIMDKDEYEKMMDLYSTDKMKGRGLGFTCRQTINILELLNYIYNENESFEVILDYRKKLFELKKEYGKEWTGLEYYIISNEQNLTDENIIKGSSYLKTNLSFFTIENYSKNYEPTYIIPRRHFNLKHFLPIFKDEEYNKKQEDLKFFYPYIFYEDNDKIKRSDYRFKNISFSIGKADELVQKMILEKKFILGVMGASSILGTFFLLTGGNQD